MENAVGGGDRPGSVRRKYEEEEDLETGTRWQSDGRAHQRVRDGGDVPSEKVDGRDIEIVDWNGPNDPDNPFNWSRKYKWTLTITTCFISILTGLPAGAYSAGNNGMSRDFHISQAGFPWLSWATASWGTNTDHRTLHLRNKC